MHLKQKVNFRIVEGVSQPDVDFEELKKDYLNKDMYVDDILKKHGISRREYRRLRKKLVEETGEPVKKSNSNKYSVSTTGEKYIYRDPLSHHFKVKKFIDGRTVHYGTYKSLDDAVKVRNVLVDHKWDWDFYVQTIMPRFAKKSTVGIGNDMDSFKSDFAKGMSVKSLTEKYGITHHHYQKLAIIVKHELGLTRKPRGFS